MVKRHYYRRLSRMLARSGGASGEGLPASEMAFMVAYLRDLFEIQHTRASLGAQFELMIDLIDHGDSYGLGEPVERPDDVLIMQARDDRGFDPEEQAALRETYPGAQARVFDAGGHSVRQANQAAYDRALFEFLDGDSARIANRSSA
jgi:pimeloyl-ACP methyl ester carboxylesterase